MIKTFKKYTKMSCFINLVCKMTWPIFLTENPWIEIDFYHTNDSSFSNSFGGFVFFLLCFNVILVEKISAV